MRIIVLILSMALFNWTAQAEDGGGKWAKRLWKVSLAAVAAGSAADIHSSLGRYETNSLLANRQGMFSAQGIGIKLAIAGAAVGTQQYLLHKHPTVSVYKTGALINFAVAGALGGVAIHNYGVSPAR